MADLSDFLPEVLPSCPGVASLVAERAVLNALREFCKTSLLIRETLTAINIVVGQRLYPLSPATGTEIITDIVVHYDGAQLRPIGEEKLDIESPSWRIGGGRSNGYHFTAPETLNLTFDPIKAVTGGLIVIVATKPSITSPVINDELYDDWNTGISQGALYELLGMPNQKWSDKTPNERYVKRAYLKWKNCLIEGKIKGDRSRTRQSQAVTQRPAATGIRR